MKSICLLKLPFQQKLVRFRIHRLFPFALFYIYFYCLTTTTVSCTPITIEQKEIPLPQGIKELFSGNKHHVQNQEQGFQTAIINEEVGDDGEGQWETVLDPRLYVITEFDTDDLEPQNQSKTEIVQQIQQRERRSHHSVGTGHGHSLSIVNPLDVLRQRLLFEIARRRMRQSNMQIIANAEILKNIG